MSKHRAVNWTLALGIVLIYVGVTWIDGPNDIEADRAVAADVQDAIQTAQVAK